jgi:hypothetical protein
MEGKRMIKVLLFDFSRTLLFPTDNNYKGELNPLHAQLSQTPDYDFNKHFFLNTELLKYLKISLERIAIYSKAQSIL